MKSIGRTSLANETGRGVLLDCGDGFSCRISALDVDLFHVLFLHDGRPLQPRTWSVPAHGRSDTPWEGRDRADESSWPIPPLTITASPARIRLATPALVAVVHLSPLRLEWALPDGRIFASDRGAQPYMRGERNARVRHAMTRHARDRYYGLGDKTGPLNLHGRRLRTKMTDALGFDPVSGDPLYKHWPFVLVREGAYGIPYGLYYDNLAVATFDLGAEHDNYYGPYRSYEAEGGDLDYYVLAGDRLADVTARFVCLIGGTALPPRWSLGFAQTAMALADAEDAQARMDDFIGRCRTHAIPVSAFHFGSGYTTIGTRRYVFHWNREKFPDPALLMQHFHAAGIHVVANLKPCLLDDHPHFAEAQRIGAFVQDETTGAPAISQFWDGEGAHIDFTNPSAIAWWQEGVQREILANGIDAVWNDNNEYNLPNETAVCHGFSEPIPLDLARPLQPLLMTRASLERQQASKPDERAFTVTRAGCPGIQRYAQSWSGDNESSWRSLKWNLRLGLQMSLSGLYNIGHDVGGFAGPVPDAELLVRWTQALVLHPRFIMNSWKPNGIYTTPWLHPEALPAIRAAIRLRYRLIPYLYSLIHEAVRYHRPMLAPTFLNFEHDPVCFDENDELMCGSYLLAAPVVAPGERARRLHLPAGPRCWYDLYSGEVLASGAEAVVAAPLDRLPLLLAAGGILPMSGTENDYSRLDDEPCRLILIFPGPGRGESRFVLWEDDGIAPQPEPRQVILSLTWTESEVTLTARGERGSASQPYSSVTWQRSSDSPRLAASYDPLGDGSRLLRPAQWPVSIP